MEYQVQGSRVPVDVVHSCESVDTTPIAVSHEAGPTLADLTAIASGGPPQVLAERYRLLRLLRHGGMGAVYLAERLGDQRQVAVKVLNVAIEERPDAIADFVREARVTARVRHPNIVDVLDFGSTPQGVVYLVMELLEGRDLRTMIRDGGLSWRWVRHLMIQICRGVDAIHRKGFVHRDLKPSNCFFVERNATVKVLDFGIAQTEHLRAESDDFIIGTPEYMAPEQIRDEPVDRRVDVYAAGIMTYELLCGRPPFVGRTPKEVFRQQLEQSPASLRHAALAWGIPAELEQLLQRALAKDPRDRFPSMRRMAAAFEPLDDVSAVCPREPSQRLSAPAFEDAPTLRARSISGAA